MRYSGGADLRSSLADDRIALHQALITARSESHRQRPGTELFAWIIDDVHEGASGTG
jgi:hypothetical protein